MFEAEAKASRPRPKPNFWGRGRGQNFGLEATLRGDGRRTGGEGKSEGIWTSATSYFLGAEFSHRSGPPKSTIFATPVYTHIQTIPPRATGFVTITSIPHLKWSCPQNTNFCSHSRSVDGKRLILELVNLARWSTTARLWTLWVDSTPHPISPGPKTCNILRMWCAIRWVVENVLMHLWVSIVYTCTVWYW